jgi:arylsulfatase A-like enzyme
MPTTSQEVDQGAAALIQDLKQRDMLKDTLVVFGSEFGRTCYSQGVLSKKTGTYGREHHRDCFSFWMAGGGIKPGISYGETDEFGYQPVADEVHVNDFHATLLHLLGIDHERLTFRHQGRDYRLTDVAGKVVKPILA